MADTVRLHFPKIVEWTPQEDITAYELAVAIPVLFAIVHGDENAAGQVDALPKPAQKHFTVSENPLNK